MRARRGPLGWGSFLLLMTVVIGFMYAGLTPWALHIGGRSTPGRQWDGLGQVQASNGGRYVLFAHLEGGRDSPGRNNAGLHGAADNVRGTAELCTESGVIHTFKLAGVVDTWWKTDGARTRIRLTGGAPVKLLADVDLHGIWHGPALELATPDNSFTQAFTPRGEIRRYISTADAGTARVVLQYGSRAEFGAACRALHGA